MVLNTVIAEKTKNKDKQWLNGLSEQYVAVKISDNH